MTQVARKHRNRAPLSSRQGGVAIITALLIVTIATVVSIEISTRLQLDVRRTSNLIAQDQASFYLVAAEAWSERILEQDRKDNKVDSLDEGWAIEIPPLPVDGGTIQGKLTDLHSCININQLIKDGKVNTVIEKRLKTLLQRNKLSPNLTQAIIDWIDTDLETTNPDGAEDGYYLNLEKPYRVANMPFTSVTELRLVRGFENPKIMRQLAPALCAFDSEVDTINVNTARAEVLQSLSEKMPESTVNAIIEYRLDTPFNTVDEFMAFEQLGTIITDKSGLTVSSDYFLLRSQARIGQANKVMYSIIRRDNSGKTEVIRRSMRTL